MVRSDGAFSLIGPWAPHANSRSFATLRMTNFLRALGRAKKRRELFGGLFGQSFRAVFSGSLFGRSFRAVFSGSLFGQSFLAVF